MTQSAITFTEVAVPVQERAARNTTTGPNPRLEAVKAAKERMSTNKALSYTVAGSAVAVELTLLRRAGTTEGVTIRTDVTKDGKRLSTKDVIGDKDAGKKGLRETDPNGTYTVTFWAVKRIEKPGLRKAVTGTSEAQPATAPVAVTITPDTDTPIADAITIPAMPVTPAKATVKRK